MNARTKKMIDNKIWEYLENEEPYWLKAIISTAKEILNEKEEQKMCKYEKRTKEDKMYEEMIEELKLEVECIQNELDNLVHELEQAERNKKAVEEIQDWLTDKFNFYAFNKTRRID